MEAVLARRARVRQSRLRNLAPLETHCLRTIAENLDYFKGKEHLFSTLPLTVLESLIEFHPELESPDWIALVAQEQTQTLNIQFESEHSFAAVCRHIQDKCKNLRGLKMHLTLPWTAKASEETTVKALYTLLRSLPHLRVLKLQSVPVTSKILKIIAQTCFQLRSLEIDNGNLRASRRKMCQLVHNCPELEEIRFPDISVRNSIIKQALFSLEKLRVFECQAIECFFEEISTENPKLNLKEIILCKSEFDSGLSTAYEMFPSLQTLILIEFTDVGQFLKFEHVTKLIVEYMSCDLLIHSYAEKLTRLNIRFCDDNIDLSMIGHFCVNLEHLYVHSAFINSHCSYTLGAEHFSRLKVVNITLVEDDDDDEEDLIPVAGNVVHRMLSAPMLNMFVSNCLLLSHTQACRLITEAEEKSVVFSELECLHIQVKEFSAITAMQLVCAIPKLKQLSLSPMLNVELHKLKDFLKTNLPHIIMA